MSTPAKRPVKGDRGEPMRQILVVRLGAMGDVIHCLPAVATLKRSFPQARIHWVIKPRWAVLLESNPNVDEVIPFDRGLGSANALRKQLRQIPFDLALDLQGLLQSALIARASRAGTIVGLDKTQAREPLSARFYTKTVITGSPHRVERYRELAIAAGADQVSDDFDLPSGSPEGRLPAEFVLASPMAGWGSKQWPQEHWQQLARAIKREMNLPLVVNGVPGDAATLQSLSPAVPHISGIAGLIDATRRATAVIGVDSGPMHLAAGLHKPGVAIFGPTDPASHGPYGGSLRVLRDPAAPTTYKRDPEIAPSMRAISPEMVLAALQASLKERVR